MGRRSRKRGALTPRDAPLREAPAAPVPRRRRALDERPPAPWGAFPLVELCILIALGLGIGGFAVGGRQGGVMLASAAVLGSLAGLELSVREHLAGFRSHTTVLAATAGVATLAGLFFAGVPRGIMLAAGATVFGILFWVLREVFKRRSGGLGFR